MVPIVYLYIYHIACIYSQLDEFLTEVRRIPSVQYNLLLANIRVVITILVIIILMIIVMII